MVSSQRLGFSTLASAWVELSNLVSYSRNRMQNCSLACIGEIHLTAYPFAVSVSLLPD